MSTIAGLVNFSENLLHRQSLVEKMCLAGKKNSPDNLRLWISDHCILGHREIIVTNTEIQSQLFSKKINGKNAAITLDGNLFNKEELVKELKALGYNLQTSSDSEIILTCYMAYDLDFLKKLNGIFAFAIWDETKNQVLIARDHFGIKPLFYSIKKNTFVFASEIKSLLQHPYITPNVGYDGLAEIFVMGPSRTPGQAIFKDILELKPAHFAIFTPKSLSIHKYWSLQSAPHTDTLEETMEKVRYLVKDSIIRQIPDMTNISSLLSGGLDSTIISAFAKEELSKRGKRLLTFSLDYVDNDKYFKPNEFQPNSDSDWIKSVVEKLKTDHKYVVLENKRLAYALKPALHARDLPGMADIDSSLYLFFQEVKKHSFFALSGEGADEVFGGYPWLRSKEALESQTFPWIRKVNERMSLLSPKIREKISPQEYLNERYKEAIKEVPKLEGENPEEARIREISYLNLSRFMPMLIDRMDRMSRSLCIETRVPFLDYRLVEYVWNIPWKMKNLNGREKGILRYSMKGLIPHEVIERKKSPYPKTHNPLFKTIVKEWLIEIIEDNSSPILQLIDKEALKDLVETDAKSFDPAWFSQLMGSAQLFAYFVQINMWLKDYKVSIVG
ncbi:asparagine synthase (glutamine-hydrolyzing) [Caldanaerobacter sp.]|uniref:asparagine synthase (glutamine-hydrolyzing) n=1 Tax=Caldanaerobacter sp. TaxID=2930036 RepID=UPI003C73820B